MTSFYVDFTSKDHNINKMLLDDLLRKTINVHSSFSC